MPVQWEVAGDESMRSIVRFGRSPGRSRVGAFGPRRGARPLPGALVLVPLHDAGAQSAVGRTRTAPSVGRAGPRLRFAFASCQQYEQGYFGAYRHIVADAPDLMLMVGQNVVATVARRTEKRLAVPLWYYLAAIVVLPLTYGFGNLAAPYYFGVDQQIVAGFAIAGMGAGLVMMGIGTAYYVLPRATGLPIYSDRLAIIGFWSFVFAAPWVGQVWSVFGPGPDHLETVAITFSGWLFIPALCVFSNFWGTMKGAWAKVFEEPSVRFVLGGTVFLAFGSLLLAFGSLRTVQNVVGFTTWEMATQTAIAGGLGMILVGLVYHLFPRIIGRALYSAGWAARQFWFTTVGLATVVVSMAVAGLIQGYLQIAGVQTEQPTSTGEGWHVITLAVRPLFILRIAGGTLVVLGLFVFIRNLVNTVVNGRDIEIEVPVAAEPEPEPVGASA